MLGQRSPSAFPYSDFDSHAGRTRSLDGRARESRSFGLFHQLYGLRPRVRSSFRLEWRPSFKLGRSWTLAGGANTRGNRSAGQHAQTWWTTQLEQPRRYRRARRRYPDPASRNLARNGPPVSRGIPGSYQGENQPASASTDRGRCGAGFFTRATPHFSWTAP